MVADPPAYAIIGYTDPAGGSNYDAMTATAVPDRDGKFVLDCTALKPGSGAVLVAVVRRMPVIPHRMAQNRDTGNSCCVRCMLHLDESGLWEKRSRKLRVGTAT